VNGLEGMSYEEHQRIFVLSTLEKRGLRGCIIALCSFLRWRRGEGGAELFSLVFSYRIHGNDSKLHQGTFRLDIRKCFFTKRLVKHWNRLHREAADAPSLSVLRGIWTMPLILCFIFWWALNCSGSGTRSLWVPSN